MLLTGGSRCFASESLTKKAKTINLMPPPLPIHVPPVYQFSQDYQELLAKIMSLPTYPKKRIMSYLLGDGHLLRFISNRIAFPSYELHHESSVCRADFNRESNKIATCSADGTVRVWDLTTGECMVLAGHTGTVLSVSFNSAGDTIVSGSEDTTVRMWDSASSDCRVFYGHSDHVNGTCFNEAGDKIASASADSTVRIWDLTTGDYKVLQHDSYVHTVCFAEGDTKVVSVGDGDARIWDLATGKFLERTFTDSGAVVTINPAKDKVVVPCGNYMIVFDITGDNCPICALYGHTNLVYYAKFNNAGDKLVSASDDRTVRVWDFSVFERFKESLIEWILVLNAVYEVVIARDFKERFPEERLALHQYATAHLDDMYFTFSMCGEELRVSLENTYKDLPLEIKQIFDGSIRKE